MSSKQGKENDYANVAPATRRRMQAVRGYDTAPEIQVRRMLHAMGHRFRLHRKDLPGSPDVVLPRHRKIVLVHGCFWHGHEGCKRAKLPSNNAASWRAKIENNRSRDQRNVAALLDLGWDVLVIWECELKEPAEVTQRLREFILHD
ncbi:MULTISPECIES: very short patch repair endonuclease [Burkholderia]|uniref:very short patch repair endonuclease n=1 Tax=Burkholderia TaxID=32008 RepID=UPI001582D293|nr:MULTISPECIES: very short patch repair endonuclease [Burkholderia]